MKLRFAEDPFKKINKIPDSPRRVESELRANPDLMRQHYSPDDMVEIEEKAKRMVEKFKAKGSDDTTNDLSRFLFLVVEGLNKAKHLMPEKTKEIDAIITSFYNERKLINLSEKLVIQGLKKSPEQIAEEYLQATYRAIKTGNK